MQKPKILQGFRQTRVVAGLQTHYRHVPLPNNARVQGVEVQLFCKPKSAKAEKAFKYNGLRTGCVYEGCLQIGGRKPCKQGVFCKVLPTKYYATCARNCQLSVWRPLRYCVTNAILLPCNEPAERTMSETEKPAMSNAERQRRYREKLKGEKADKRVSQVIDRKAYHLLQCLAQHYDLTQKATMEKLIIDASNAILKGMKPNSPEEGAFLSLRLL